MSDEPRPVRSWKIDGIREAFQNADPKMAADQAARRLKLDSIPLPTLLADEPTKRWEQDRLRAAREVYLRIAVDGPVELRGVARTQKESEALTWLRRQGLLAETTGPTGLIMLATVEDERDEG